MARFTLALLAGAALAAGTLAVAQDMMAPEVARDARQGHMKAFGEALRTLGGMAQGQVAYDAAAAREAADALLANAASPDWAVMWPQGSAQGEIADSAALPAIWENMADFQAKHQALVDAATAMQAAAGTDLASLQAALGPVGASCAGCHQVYRAPQG